MKSPRKKAAPKSDLVAKFTGPIAGLTPMTGAEKQAHDDRKQQAQVIANFVLIKFLFAAIGQARGPNWMKGIEAAMQAHLSTVKPTDPTLRYAPEVYDMASANISQTLSGIQITD